MDQDNTRAALDSPNTDNVVDGDKSLNRRQKTDFLTDLEAHDEYIVDYDSYEAMLISRTYDSVSRETKSGITDGSATTIALERAARVVGAMPDGETKASGKKDYGKGMLLDLFRLKYLYPNANSQWPFLTKLRMWQFYSSVYGFMPMFVDWTVNNDGYVGPDCWLWNPRNFIPQNGKTNIRDMDYCNAFAFVTADYLEDLLDEDEEAGWIKQTVKELIKVARDNSLWNDVRRDTYIKRIRTFQAIRGQIPLVTRFEAGKDGHWITFCPWFGFRILRDIPNPHKTNQLPWFIKPGIPLFDSFYGLGDFQRERPLQFAKDGLTNFYFEGLKMNIYPPTVVNINGIVKSSIDQRPGAIWMENVPNSVRRLETSTAGLSTYTSAITQLQAAMQSQAGVTDTMTSAEDSADPTVGKTPAALNMVNERLNTRDSQEAFYLEQETDAMINYMLQLFINIGTEQIDLNLFSEDIQDIISAGYSDIVESMDISSSGNSAKIHLKSKDFKDLEVKYQTHPGSMKQTTNAQKAESLSTWFGVLSKMQNEVAEMRNQGEQPNWKLLFTLYGQAIGVPELNKMWIPVTPEQQQQEQQQQQAEAQAANQPHVVYKMTGQENPQEVATIMDKSGYNVPIPPAALSAMTSSTGSGTMTAGGVNPTAGQINGTSIPQVNATPPAPNQIPGQIPGQDDPLHPSNFKNPAIQQAAANMKAMINQKLGQQ